MRRRLDSPRVSRSCETPRHQLFCRLRFLAVSHTPGPPDDGFRQWPILCPYSAHPAPRGQPYAYSEVQEYDSVPEDGSMIDPPGPIRRRNAGGLGPASRVRSEVMVRAKCTRVALWRETQIAATRRPGCVGFLPVPQGRLPRHHSYANRTSVPSGLPPLTPGAGLRSPARLRLSARRFCAAT